MYVVAASYYLLHFCIRRRAAATKTSFSSYVLFRPMSAGISFFFLFFFFCCFFFLSSVCLMLSIYVMSGSVVCSCAILRVHPRFLGIAFEITNQWGITGSSSGLFSYNPPTVTSISPTSGQVWRSVICTNPFFLCVFFLCVFFFFITSETLRSCGLFFFFFLPGPTAGSTSIVISGSRSFDGTCAFFIVFLCGRCVLMHARACVRERER